MTRLAMLTALLVLTLGVTSQAAAQATCANAQFDSSVTDQFPWIREACEEIVTRDGTDYARVTVEVRSVQAGRVRLWNEQARKQFTVSPPPGRTIMIGDEEVRFQDLQRGQEIRNYFAVTEPVVVTAVERPQRTIVVLALVEEPEPMAQLPRTASPLPLVALLGGLFVAVGGMLTGIRWFRNRG